MNTTFRRFLAALLWLAFLVSLTACSEPKDDRPTEGIGVATLSAVGDIYLTQEMLLASQSAGSYDFMPLFSDIVTSVAPADIAIGNFEGNFAESADGSYPDELAAALAGTGFDILQTANSYSVYNGLSGLERTKAIIREHGITPIGTYNSQTEQSQEQVLIREVNGIRFAFVSFTKGFQGMGVPSGSEHCVDLLYSDYTTDYEDVNTDGILAILEKAKEKKPDFIIAALHWGSENVSVVSETQEEITSLMFRNGVDVILGSHSHRVGEVETKQITTEDDKQKTCVVAYSLGDFCATESGDSNTAIILNLEFTRDHASGKTEISNLSYTPVSTVDNGEEAERRFRVVNTDDAIALYEGNYYLRISDDAYKNIVSDRKNLDSTVFPTEED